MLDFTGERYIPSVKGQIYCEHLHRYAIAARACGGKRVLDVASGEGYGAALLARYAADVVGVDVDAEIVAHARRTYYVPNLRFVNAPATELPLADASIDVVTCFETIEHLSDHDRMVDEFRRVLASGGTLFISSPNKLIYSDRANYKNPFHVRELYYNELRDLLKRRFSNVMIYGQRLVASSVLHPLAGVRSGEAGWYAGDLTAIEDGLPTLGDPVYFLAVCSDAPLRDRVSSGFVDPNDNVFDHLLEELEMLRGRIYAGADAGPMPEGIQVALPVPGPSPQAASAPAHRPRLTEREAGLIEQLERRARVGADCAEPAERVLQLEAELAERLDEVGRLEAEIARRDEAEARVAAERAAAEQAHEDALAAECGARTALEAELRSRDAMLAERDVMLAERDAMLAERDAAIASRDGRVAELRAAVIERDREIELRNAAVREGNALLAKRDAAAAQRDARIAGLERALDERNIYAETAIASLREKMHAEQAEALAGCEARIAELQARLAESEAATAELRERAHRDGTALQAILTSTSWKATEPLRRAASIVRPRRSGSAK